MAGGKSRNYLQLQKEYGGQYIASDKNGSVVAAARTYHGLLEKVKATKRARNKLVFEFIEPYGAVCVYFHLSSRS